MFAAEFHTSRHHIAIVAMACLCVLWAGLPVYAGAESLFIAGATYYGPGVSGPGWAGPMPTIWSSTATGDAIGADGDLVVTLAGRNSVVESHAPDADITQCGMEVWGSLTRPRHRLFWRLRARSARSTSRGRSRWTAAPSMPGRTGQTVTDEAVAGVIAARMAVRGGGRVVAAGAAPAAGVQAFGVYLQDAGAGDGSAGRGLSVDVSRLDATGADGGVACTGGSLVSARFVAPAGGAFGAGGVVDASGAMAPHVVVEPQGATAPAGETDGREVPGGAGEPAGGAGPAVERPGAGSATDPVLKPASTTPKTTATTKTTAIKTAASTPSNAKNADAATATLPKTADSSWIAASLALFLLGAALLGVTRRYSCIYARRES